MTIGLRTSYIIISGKGRSGSNRLLDMLDASRQTICRSEVNEIAETGFAGVGGALFSDDFSAEQLAQLQATLPDAMLRRSARDRLTQRDKAYLTTIGRTLVPALGKARLRQALRQVGLMKSAQDWPLPSMALNHTTLPQAQLVLKLNSCPAWATALAQANKNARILHNIRDPLDYLQSWYNRFIIGKAGLSSFTKNFRDVPRILAYFGRTGAEHLAEPREENIVEVELWRWRYVNTHLHRVAAHSDQYLLMSYTEIEADLLAAARRVFAFADLPFEAPEEARIRALDNVLFQKPHTTRLDPELCHRLIAKVLEDCPLHALARRVA